jgi:voltage-gated potassium channel
MEMHVSGHAQAAPDAPEQNVRSNSMYELFLGLLTLISLVTMVLLYFLRVFVPDSPVTGVLWAADTLFCVIFLFDFFRSLALAENRRDYLFWHGILDLLGSLPSIPALRLARLARVIRVARFLRARSARSLAHEFVERRAESALYLTGLLAILLLIVGSSLVLVFEPHADGANISTGRDAFWWAYVTITTVGYGDRFPVTNGGRIIGIVLMTFGIGIFGVLTSFMSSLFLAPKPHSGNGSEPRPTDEEPAASLADRRQLQADLDAVRRELVEIKQLLRDRQQV